MKRKKTRAAALLREFKGDAYRFGVGCFADLGAMARAYGRRASVVASGFTGKWGIALHRAVHESLDNAGVATVGPRIRGARPNAPREDVLRIADALAEQNPEVIVAAGGGSCIDAVKAAAAFYTLRDQFPDLDGYFGLGQVSAMLEAAGRAMPPIIAAQIASGSAAHLTKYANVTELEKAQKMLIVDDAIVPPKAVFDYGWTASMSPEFTKDGALDGVAHCLEVLYGVPAKQWRRAGKVSLLGIDLIVNNLKAACDDPGDLAAREALGLGTDLGGYAIMIGGTNGAHLNSFSFVDILPHGRACALMNPYYTVFFAPAIEPRLRAVGAIYKKAGYTDADLDGLHGRDLGLAVAEAMLAQSDDVGFPKTLNEVPGFTAEHVTRALAAAKDPKLETKLKNMPVPLTGDDVDSFMGPVLEAARTGDFGLIQTVSR